MKGISLSKPFGDGVKSGLLPNGRVVPDPAILVFSHRKFRFCPLHGRMGGGGRSCGRPRGGWSVPAGRAAADDPLVRPRTPAGNSASRDDACLLSHWNHANHCTFRLMPG